MGAAEQARRQLLEHAHLGMSGRAAAAHRVCRSRCRRGVRTAPVHPSVQRTRSRAAASSRRRRRGGGPRPRQALTRGIVAGQRGCDGTVGGWCLSISMLIETDLAGGPVRVDDLDRDSVLWFAEQAKAREAAAALAVLHATIRWCETNTVDDPKWAAGFGEVGGDLDCPEKIGGDGRPMVAAFSAEPLAAAMEISTTSALTLMADALELAHRLPRVMARVEALEVPVWRARSIAQATSVALARRGGLRRCRDRRPRAPGRGGGAGPARRDRPGPLRHRRPRRGRADGAGVLGRHPDPRRAARRTLVGHLVDADHRRHRHPGRPQRPGRAYRPRPAGHPPRPVPGPAPGAGVAGHRRPGPRPRRQPRTEPAVQGLRAPHRDPRGRHRAPGPGGGPRTGHQRPDP